MDAFKFTSSLKSLRSGITCLNDQKPKLYMCYMTGVSFHPSTIYPKASPSD